MESTCAPTLKCIEGISNPEVHESRAAGARRAEGKGDVPIVDAPRAASPGATP